MTTKNIEARREAFERKYPLLDGMYWDEERATYAGNKLFWLYQDRWECYNAALDSICVELPNSKSLSASDDPWWVLECCQEALTAAGVPYK